MSKAVLVMDMPESCRKCNLSYMIPLGTRLICHATAKVIRTTHDKPDWCPLRELPEKMEVCGTYNSEYYAKGGKMPSYKTGWNACLDEILGEKDDGTTV